MLDQVVSIILDAGKIARIAWKNKEFSVFYKGDSSIITTVDEKIHSYLSLYLSKVIDCPILSEEGCDVSKNQSFRECQYLWVMDPLDGTRDFVAGRDEFTVNISLLSYGKVILSVIHAPVRNTLYATDVYGKAYCVQGIFHQTHQDKNLFLMSHSPCNNDKKIVQNLYFPVVHQGASLKFCTLIESSGSIYFRSECLYVWDLIAGFFLCSSFGHHVNFYKEDIFFENTCIMSNDLRMPPFIIFHKDIKNDTKAMILKCLKEPLRDNR